MGTDPLFILLCDPFPDLDSQFVTRSDPDPELKFLIQSRYYLYIQLIRFYFIIRNNIYVGIVGIIAYLCNINC